jgi:SAM-dependent methyltransferase
MGDDEYLFDNRAEQAGDRFDALGALFDPVTRARLERVGVTSGWRCLDVGAGGGSVARWLADRVGPTGEVVATDLDVRWIEDHLRGPNIEIRQHDVTADPLEPDGFDLIHERLVLVHLATREAVLDKLIGALRPGGWLVVEDFDTAHSIRAMDPQADDEALGTRLMDGIRTLLSRRGADPDLGHKLHQMLGSHGLVEVGGDAYQAHDLGHVTRHLRRANLVQVADDLVAGDIATRPEIDAYLELLASGDVPAPTPVLVGAWGRRPPDWSPAS